MNAQSPASTRPIGPMRVLTAGLVSALVGMLSACGGGGGGDGGSPDIGTSTITGVSVPVLDEFGGAISGGELRVRMVDGRENFSISQSGMLSGVVKEVERHPINQLCRVSVSGAQSTVSCSKTLINDTGVSDCFEGGVKKECGSGGVAAAAMIAGAPLAAAGVTTGAMGIQDGAKGRDPESSRLRKLGCGSAGFDFSRLGADGKVIAEAGGCPTPSAVDARWVCTRDNVTGLVWLRAPSAPAAFGAAPAPAAACGFAGGWRAPAADELASLIHSGSSDVAIDRARFPDVRDELYWTSSANRVSTTGAYAIRFSLSDTRAGFVPGGGIEFVSKDRELPTLWVNVATRGEWRVRLGLPQASNRFEPDFARGVITDHYSGLMWMLCSIGRESTRLPPGDPPCSGTATDISWEEALDSVLTANQNAALGYSDWRLPNRAELVSLLDYAEDQVMVHSALRNDAQNAKTDGATYWSSTGTLDAEGNVLIQAVDFKLGTTGPLSTTDARRVRLVRSVP